MLWIYLNMALDEDEKMDRMCPKCREEATSTNKCIRCGADLDTDGEDSFINPNFDVNKFNALKGDTSNIAKLDK